MSAFCWQKYVLTLDLSITSNFSHVSVLLAIACPYAPLFAARKLIILIALCLCCPLCASFPFTHPHNCFVRFHTWYWNSFAQIQRTLPVAAPHQSPVQTLLDAQTVEATAVDVRNPHANISGADTACNSGTTAANMEPDTQSCTCARTCICACA